MYVVERNDALAGRRFATRRTTKQLGDPLVIGGIDDQPFLQDPAELIVELPVRPGSSCASRSRRSSTPLTIDVRIFRMTLLSCSVSRETFSGKSSESTSPRRNRRYSGRSSRHSLWTSTRLAHRLSPCSSRANPRFSRLVGGQ